MKFDWARAVQAVIETSIWVVCICVVLATLVLLPGCASTATDQEKEEAAWRLQVDRENWAMCKLAYKRAGRYTMHRGHSHDDSSGRIYGLPETWALKHDLIDNKCRMVLTQAGYWVEY